MNKLNYKKLIELAMLNMVKEILTDIAENGLPGNHHFYITFNTQNQKVDIPDWMLKKYPEKMTIVLKNWFENLVTTAHSFEVTLNFDNQTNRLKVPFDSLELFADPSVDFALSFTQLPTLETKTKRKNKDKRTEKTVNTKTNTNIVDFKNFKK